MSFRFNSAVSGSPGSGSESSDGRLLVDGRTSEGGGVVCPPWQAVTPRLLGALTMTDVTEASHSVSLSPQFQAVAPWLAVLAVAGGVNEGGADPVLVWFLRKPGDLLSLLLLVV